MTAILDPRYTHDVPYQSPCHLLLRGLCVQTGAARAVARGPMNRRPPVWLDDPATTSLSYPVYNPAQDYIAGYMTVRKQRRQHSRVCLHLLHRGVPDQRTPT